MARLIIIVCAIGCAAIIHLGILLFGGWFFVNDHEPERPAQQVELLNPDSPTAKEKEKPKEPPPDEKQDLKAEEDRPPDAADMMRDIEATDAAAAPALDAASLGAIEAALGGSAGGGSDFGQAVNFASGGKIGGTGRGGALDGGAEGAFGIGEIDQRPRSMVQAMPVYPVELRGKKVEGVVSVAFIVDAEGKVVSQRVEKSSHPAFEKPALDAVRKWTFEPAVRGGKRVPCKMRQSIRFQPNQS